MERQPCQRCQVKMASRPKRLCWVCYYRHGSEFKTLSPHGERTVASRLGNHRGMPTPTRVLPGTEAKRRVMEERADGCLALFHPQDAEWVEDNDPERERQQRRAMNEPLTTESDDAGDEDLEA